MDKRIFIWREGNIPGNTGESKLTVMQPDLNMTMEQIFRSKGGVFDKSTLNIPSMVPDDSLVWQNEIVNGYAQETFSDVPFLIPYLVEGSDRCVICCPGGAYLFKSMEGEGSDIAEFLNAQGISVFVLWYRTYPNFSPLMFLDLQRAVRYIRYHAGEYGIDPEKIAAVGFSAGGNLVGVHAVRYGNKEVEYPGYVPDEIDRQDGRLNAAGLIYPAVDLSNDKALAALGGFEAYQDKEKRKALADSLDILHHLDKECPPLFLCAAQDDEMVNPVPLAELNVTAMKLGISTEFHMFPSGGHGFGGCVLREGPFGKPDYSVVGQWKGLFANWILRTL